MNRRAFIGAFAGGLLAAPLAVEGQHQARVYRVGILSSDAAADPRAVELRDGLRALGYIEGKNLVVSGRWADGDLDRLPALAAELVDGQVDVIVTLGAAVWAAKRQTSTVPIVIAFSGDTVATGVVSSFARPGGNITGLSFMATDLAAKRLELLKEAFPGIAHVAVLYNPGEVATVPELRETEITARALGVTLQLLQGQHPDELEGLFATAARERTQALVVFAHGFAYQNRSRIAELAARQRLPAMFGWREFVEAGGLMSYGPNVRAVVRRAAIYVDKILKGARPADLPIEQPTRFELIINLKTAKALGLTIPPSLLQRADQVIE
jgi:ABC-type uncharacterized transport system substrate-binding protein